MVTTKEQVLAGKAKSIEVLPLPSGSEVATIVVETDIGDIEVEAWGVDFTEFCMKNFEYNAPILAKGTFHTLHSYDKTGSHSKVIMRAEYISIDS